MHDHGWIYVIVRPNSYAGAFVIVGTQDRHICAFDVKASFGKRFSRGSIVFIDVESCVGWIRKRLTHLQWVHLSRRTVSHTLESRHVATWTAKYRNHECSCPHDCRAASTPSC